MHIGFTKGMYCNGETMQGGFSSLMYNRAARRNDNLTMHLPQESEKSVIQHSAGRL